MTAIDPSTSVRGVYDVTQWPYGDAREDIGDVINDIIAHVRSEQTRSDEDGSGKPGAVITIPPGDYRLRTQIRIDISFLRIQGAGHGFTSSSIRFNVPREEWPDLHELWPGGSRVLVDLPVDESSDPRDGAAIVVQRDGSPRISSIEFADFCIDGLHFTGRENTGNPENSYVNGKTGILVASANDSLRISGMGLIYLEHGLVLHNADALSVTDNFIAECGSCIELRGWGQASKITNNLIGAGPWGHSIYAENHGGLLIATNNVFPRGASSVHLEAVTRSSVTANRLHSFYPSMILLAGGSSENIVASNHLLRDHEPWTPFLDVDNGEDDSVGLLRISGDDNSVIGNHISEVIQATRIRPAGTRPVIIKVEGGRGNHLYANHIVALDATAATHDSAFEAQVEALLSTSQRGRLSVVTVEVASDAEETVVLDTGRDDEVVADRRRTAVRPIPAAG